MTVPSSGVREQRVLVAAHRARLGRRDEARPEPHAVGAERDRGGEAATVEDAAGRDDRHTVADLVDDLRHERHRRDGSGVAAGFGALRDHEVAARFDRGDRVAHLAAHARDEHVAVVQDLDDVARHAEPGDEQRRAAGHDLVRVVEHALGQRGEQVDAERLVGAACAPPRISSSSCSDDIVAAPSVPKPPASDTAATTRVVRDAAHPGEHHGVFDPQHLGESCRMGASGHRCTCAVTAYRGRRGRPARLGVIMGSDSDLPVDAGRDRRARRVRRRRTRCASSRAHRTPEVMYEYARVGRRPRAAGDHRGRRRRRAPAGHDRVDDAAAGDRRPGAARAARRARLAAVDRADARRHPGRDVAIGNATQRRPARRAHPRARATRSCAPRWSATRPTSREQVRDKDAKRAASGSAGSGCGAAYSCCDRVQHVEPGRPPGRAGSPRSRPRDRGEHDDEHELRRARARTS